MKVKNEQEAIGVSGMLDSDNRYRGIRYVKVLAVRSGSNPRSTF